MSNDQCRDEFESFYSTNGMHKRVIERSGGSYSLPEAAVAWWVWKTCWNTRTQQKPEQGAAGPVMYQCRMRAGWQKQWYPWEACSKEIAEDYKRAPLVHDWHYEVRELFTAPPAPDADAKDAVLLAAREAVEEFKRRLYKVPNFGSKVNKATRIALSEAYSPILNLPAMLDRLALAAQPTTEGG